MEHNPEDTNRNAFIVLTIYNCPVVDQEPSRLSVFHHVEWGVAVIVSYVDIPTCHCLRSLLNEEPNRTTFRNEVLKNVQMAIRRSCMPRTGDEGVAMDRWNGRSAHGGVSVRIRNIGRPSYVGCYFLGSRVHLVGRTMVLNQLLERLGMREGCLQERPGRSYLDSLEVAVTSSDPYVLFWLGSCWCWHGSGGFRDSVK